VLGRLTREVDPNRGPIDLEFNGFGDLVYQQDAKGSESFWEYDRLGRVTRYTSDDGVAEWIYDEGPGAIGLLTQLVGLDGYEEYVAYDALSRPVSEFSVIDGETFVMSLTRDHLGRAFERIYPSGFAVTLEYNSQGALSSLSRSGDGSLLWEATAYSATLQPLTSTLGNGVVSTRTYDSALRSDTITAGVGGGGEVLDWAFGHDAAGNVDSRIDANGVGGSLVESFTYDSLNRVETATIAGGATRTYGYDPIGNLIQNPDVGALHYGVGAGPHAVTSSELGGATLYYHYDANGNMTCRASLDPATCVGGLSVDYNAQDLPTQMTLGGATHSFSYDPFGGRLTQTVSVGGSQATTVYVGGSYERRTTAGSPAEHIHYVDANGQRVAMVTLVDGTTSTRYLHHDHLGSVVAMTDEAGVVVERQSYDAFGARRNLDGTPATAPVPSDATRGFTEHEHLDDLGLVHMNARVFDPKLGRSLQADSIIPDPMNGQSYNRYSYVENRPLSAWDPTGNEWVQADYNEWYWR